MTGKDKTLKRGFSLKKTAKTETSSDYSCTSPIMIMMITICHYNNYHDDYDFAMSPEYKLCTNKFFPQHRPPQPPPDMAYMYVACGICHIWPILT